MTDQGDWHYEALGTALPADVFAKLLEELPEGVLVADARGTLLLANRRADRLTRQPVTERIGEGIRAVLPLLELDGRSYWDVENPWGGLQTRSGAPERPVVTPSGITLLVATRHVRLPDRSLSHVVMSLRDGRTRERSEQQMSALIAATAHELRSPLSAIRGFSKALRGRWDQLREDQKHWILEAIELDAARLSRLVNELLDVSRIDTGRIQLRRQALDLVKLAEQRVQRRSDEGHHPGRFRLESSDDVPPVWADSDRMTQVIDNLLDNATIHGSGDIVVTLALGDHDTVMLSVTDQGVGIPPDHAELVFSRFWQGGDRNGSGLGLYIVRGLLGAQGGTIQVVPTTAGACFRVTLPAGLPEHLR